MLYLSIQKNSKQNSAFHADLHYYKTDVGKIRLLKRIGQECLESYYSKGCSTDCDYIYDNMKKDKFPWIFKTSNMHASELCIVNINIYQMVYFHRIYLVNVLGPLTYFILDGRCYINLGSSLDFLIKKPRQEVQNRAAAKDEQEEGGNSIGVLQVESVLMPHIYMSYVQCIYFPFPKLLQTIQFECQ